MIGRYDYVPFQFVELMVGVNVVPSALLDAFIDKETVLVAFPPEESGTSK